MGTVIYISFVALLNELINSTHNDLIVLEILLAIGNNLHQRSFSWLNLN